jgi:uncharacterized membrane protein YbaN (DUF454 family)
MDRQKRILRSSQKMLYFGFGQCFLVLGIIGIFLPLLPTTPFVLLAAWCFSRSSEKWHQWLLRQKKLGPIIADWEKYGVIRLRPKLLASVLMVLLFGYTLIFVDVNHIIKMIVSLTGGAILIFIWSRPSQPKRGVL